MAFPKNLLAEHETLVFDLKPHWIAVVPSALWTLAAVLIFIVGSRLANGRSVEGGVQLVLGIVALLMFVSLAVIPFLRWQFTMFVLTSDRLITRQGGIAKHSKEIPLERINDVTFSQSVIERALGAGDLILESAGERGQTIISNVRKPEQVQLVIYKETEDNNLRMMRPEASGGPTAASVPEQIQALARLKDQGVLTEAEFEQKKRDLLDRM